MKSAFAATLAIAFSCSLVPAAHAQSSNLAHQVYSAAAHDGVGLSHVFVLTHDGDVTLVGWVPEHDQVAIAEQAAMKVQGVTSVTNKLSFGFGRSQ